MRWHRRTKQNRDEAEAEAHLRKGLGRLRADGKRARPTRELQLEYPVQPSARWGYGRPPNPALAATIHARDAEYEALLRRFVELGEELGRIPAVADKPGAPRWDNPYFFGLDAVALYGLLSTTAPRTLIEIGSGFSTAFARQAIGDHGLGTRVVAVDPEPRSDIADLCDDVVRDRLENLPATFFDEIEAGDFVFLDSSHVALMNSDVTVFFLEVLPRLRAGVFVHVHDVFLPWDYRPDWTDRWYSEQYLLAAYLLAGSALEIVLPNFHVYTDPPLAAELAPLWRRLGRSGYETAGHSFWVRTSSGPVV